MCTGSYIPNIVVCSAASDFAFSSAERELFLWCLLFNRRALAKIFWRMCREPTGAALVASRLLKSLAGQPLVL